MGYIGICEGSACLLDGDVHAHGRVNKRQVVPIAAAVLGNQVVLVDTTVAASPGCFLAAD